jgi:hypothetical protein
MTTKPASRHNGRKGPKADIVHCSNLATDLEVEKAGKSFSQAASGAKYLT